MFISYQMILYYGIFRFFQLIFHIHFLFIYIFNNFLFTTIFDIFNFAILIGMVHFVQKWNKVVEISLQGNFSNLKDEKRIPIIQKKIETLIDDVQEQEDEIFVLKKRNSDLEKARIWFERNSAIENNLKNGMIHISFIHISNMTKISGLRYI